MPRGRPQRVTQSTLYVCYFGLREPLVQTQVLPYLRQLVAAGFRVNLLTFEPRLGESWAAGELSSRESALAAEGISWFRLPYHKSPSLPATAYDIWAGGREAARIVRERSVDVIHARSHVAAVMGAAAKRRTGRPLVFDIRGFFPEEYVDAGVWPANGTLYRGAKRAERRLLKSADGFVVLTEKARAIMFPAAGDAPGGGGAREGNDSETRGHADARGRPVEVIPCCVDLERFRAADAIPRDEVRRELNVGGRRVVVYLGALGGWYMTDEMADLLAAAHEQDARTFTLVLTQSPPEMIAGPLRRRGVAPEDVLIRRVAPADVPRYLKAADAAVSFIKPCYSKLSSSPTKLAEYLASGLPVVCNAGVGDVDEVVETDGVGVVVREMTRDAYLAALARVEEMRGDGRTAARCRASAAARFDLRAVGGRRYVRLYERVLAAGRAGAGL